MGVYWKGTLTKQIYLSDESHDHTHDREAWDQRRSAAGISASGSCSGSERRSDAKYTQTSEESGGGDKGGVNHVWGGKSRAQSNIGTLGSGKNAVAGSLGVRGHHGVSAFFANAVLQRRTDGKGRESVVALNASVVSL
jgi:hypothetical protein